MFRRQLHLLLLANSDGAATPDLSLGRKKKKTRSIFFAEKPPPVATRTAYHPSATNDTAGETALRAAKFVKRLDHLRIAQNDTTEIDLPLI